MKRTIMNRTIAVGLKASRALLGCLMVACSTSTEGTEVGAAPTEPAPSAGDTPSAGQEETGPSVAPPPANPAKPGCAQEAYTETLPTKTSLSDIPFSKSTANDFLLAALGKRYPLGKAIVEGGLASPVAKSQGNCINRFLDDTSSASAVLRQASTVVHECGHIFDLGEASGSKNAYVIRPNEVSFTCKDGDTKSRGGVTFARSLIKQDAYYVKRKACAPGTSSAGCDIYAGIYLDGSPSDSTFDSGDQGYNFVLEEATQYVNSLASALAFQDQYTGTKVSERDGILTFLWYIERYLALARTSYPAAYELLTTDACWRQATLTVWDRGWFYLHATEGLSNLGIEDTKIETLVNEPALLAEIDNLRSLECK